MVAKMTKSKMPMFGKKMPMPAPKAAMPMKGKPPAMKMGKMPVKK